MAATGQRANHGRLFAHARHQIVVDAGRLGVLDVDGDVGLAAAVDLAAGSGDAHAVRHALVHELLVQLVHQGLHHARGVARGYVAMQPTLGVGDHGHRIPRPAHREAFRRQLIDEGLNLVGAAHHELDVAPDGEADMTLGELVGDVAELADGMDIHLALGARPHRPHFVPALRRVVEHAGTGPVVP
jgi:hypothetical protein